MSPCGKLSERDSQVVADCLRASVEGQFFPDREFSTLFGLKREEVRDVWKRWPAGFPEDRDTFVAAVNAVNNLLGYPHGLDSKLADYTAAEKDEMHEILQRMTGVPRSATSYLQTSVELPRN